MNDALLLWAILGLGFFGGLASGMAVEYFKSTKPLLDKYAKLVHKMYMMKRRGFVPQFDIQQPRPEDPAEEVTEY